MESLERHQTAPYLPRVLLASLCFALLSSALIASLWRGKPETISPTISPSPGNVIVEIKNYNSEPASGLAGWTPPIVRQHGHHVPVPDAELLPEEEYSEHHVGAASLHGAFGADDIVSFPGPGSAGWTPSRPEPPAVFLFVEVPPELVSLAAPAYPELAREAAVEGTVLVQVLVSELGVVLEASIKQSVPLLDEAALAAAFSALFRPAQQSGRPVRTRVVIPIEFSLRR